MWLSNPFILHKREEKSKTLTRCILVIENEILLSYLPCVYFLTGGGGGRGVWPVLS
jgi:hypothetical protein